MRRSMLHRCREDQVEQHGHETIDEASGDSDMKQGGDTSEEADQEADWSRLIGQDLFGTTKERMTNAYSARITSRVIW